MVPKSMKGHGGGDTKGGNSSKDAAASKGGASGKGKTTTASETKGKWMASSVSTAQQNHLAGLGYLPPQEHVTWRSLVTADGTMAEVSPVARNGVKVPFIPFLVRGLSLPVHEFFRGLMYFYQLQMHHLTPNDVLHIACFVTLYECFLGIRPHFGLWRRYFQFMLQTNVNETSECGGSATQLQPGTGYIKCALPNSNKKWQEGLFYCPDMPVDIPARPGLSPYVPEPPSRRHALAQGSEATL